MSRHWPAICFGKIVVLVPAAMEKLDEAHAAFRQAARHHAIGGKRARFARVGTVSSNTASGSFDRSVSSGTDDCMRNAISYCEMRV